MQLGPHFSLDEFIRSHAAESRGIANNPQPRHIDHLRHWVTTIGEPVREHFGQPVPILSGYRSSALNRAVGGATASAHCRGLAADIRVKGIDNAEVASWIRRHLPFDQLILEFYCPQDRGRSSWVHVAVGIPAAVPTPLRHQTLLATKDGRSTVYHPIPPDQPLLEAVLEHTA